MKPSKNKITLNLDSDVSVSVKGFIAPIEYTEHNFHIDWDELANLQVAKPEKQYRETVFQSFLPPKSVSVGECWKIEEIGVLELLRQLHPNPGMDVGASRGAWACLRAYNDQSADIVFRIHVKFDLAEGRFTPSQFAGNLIIDRIEEKITFFQTYVPDGPLNFNTAKRKNETYKGRPLYSTDIGFCPQIELRAGTPDILQETEFIEAINQAAVEKALAVRFYKYQEINWVPLEEAVEMAPVQQKPIHAISIDGSLVDESC